MRRARGWLLALARAGRRVLGRVRIWVMGPVARLVILAVALASVALLVWGQVQINQQNRISNERRDAEQAHNHCVAMWADAYARRADRINSLSNERTDALKTYIGALSRVLSDAIRLDRSTFRHDEAAYLKAIKDYDDASTRLDTAQKLNPLPPSPKLACA